MTDENTPLKTCGLEYDLTHDSKLNPTEYEKAKAISPSKLTLWHDEHNVNMLGLHLVWCTKFRHPLLVEGVDITVKRAIGQTCADNGWVVHNIEVMPDHVHLFVQVHPTDAPVTVVKILKSTSAIAVFSVHSKLKANKFWGTGLWSKGSYYGSVGQISQNTVSRYIQMQKTKQPKK